MSAPKADVVIAGETFDHPLFGHRFPAIPFYAGTAWFLPLAGVSCQVMDWLQ